ncbi:terminase gpA endonuclease subunit [Crateriforma conspicua]|uniref:Phage terminase large subunit (GpA) n=1 Tax=Crateriforma conspicua TaxID=2527996 RepID=A0A5C6FYR5_9PLAN|nr:terminase gpA endonuclease subunit [Crateriforma conspicua]TWU66440.1 Phage terminase large subunit (GpA) [Crateriforma conspicua]
MATVIEHEFAAALRRAKSTPPRTFRQWIQEELIIPDGPAEKKRFKIDRQPAIGLWIDAVDDPQWQEMIFTAVTQYGKTLFGFVCPLLYHATELGQKIGVGVPFGDMANDKYQADIKPTMQMSPNLRRHLPVRGPGSADGTVRGSLQLASGSLWKFMSAGADDAGKAGFTCPTIVVTEAAKFSQAGASSVESDPLRQLYARQRSYQSHRRRSYVEGTLTIESELPWTLHDASSRSKIVSPCPHCCEFIAPEREHFVGWKEAHSEVAATKAAHWVCPKCGKKITESQRHRSLFDAVLLHAGQKIDRKGRVTGPPPETTRLWYHATPWVNCLLEAQDIARDEYLAAQIPEDTEERTNADKQLAQFTWSMIYRPPKVDGEITITREGIAARTNGLAKGRLPSDVQFVTIGMDTGHRTAWYLVLASCADGRLKIIDYGSFDVPSHQARPKEAIVAALGGQVPYLEAGFSVEGGDALRAHSVWVDCSDNQEATWEFTRGVNPRQSLNQWVIAARGRGESQMDRRRFTCPSRKNNTVRQIADDKLWYVQWIKAARIFEVSWDADKVKWLAQHGLCLPVESPASITLFEQPEKAMRTFTRHIRNEKLLHEFVPGKGWKSYWWRTGANHYLDCLAMAYAAQCRLGYQPPAVRMHRNPDGSPSAVDQAAAPTTPKKKPAKLPADKRKKVSSWFRSV